MKFKKCFHFSNLSVNVHHSFFNEVTDRLCMSLSATFVSVFGSTTASTLMSCFYLLHFSFPSIARNSLALDVPLLDFHLALKKQLQHVRTQYVHGLVAVSPLLSDYSHALLLAVLLRVDFFSSNPLPLGSTCVDFRETL